MKLNKKDLKKIQYSFNNICNRLLQANYDDYAKTLRKFVEFIENTSIINDYILACGQSDKDIAESSQKIFNSYGRYRFVIGESDEEEVRDVFAILKYMAENNISPWSFGMAYTTSKKYQDMVVAFNQRVVMILINHIETYLTDIGIDMGMDENVYYTIEVQNGQVNIATENAMLTAYNDISVSNNMKLDNLIQAIKENANGLSNEDEEILNNNLEIIENEVKSSNPKNGIMAKAISTLKAIKGTTEFAAAIAALAQFISAL